MEFDKLKPEILFHENGLTGLGDTVRDTFRSQRPILEHLGLDEYSLTRYDAAAFYLLSLILDSGYDLSRANVLEIGCGIGMKAFPIAGHVKSYVGVDLDEEGINRAKFICSQLSLTNTTFICANAADIFLHQSDVPAEHRFNVIFLHAVMEHLTPEERAVIFPVLRKCWEDGGLIIVGESPNRLLPFDYHSTELHFLQMLPDHIAIPYCERSPREVAQQVAQLGRTSYDKGREALYRLGRGLSYHDFELSFSADSARPDVLWDSYHPALLNFQPISHAELQLSKYFRSNSLQVHRLWSRANVDLHMWKGNGKRSASSGVECSDFTSHGDVFTSNAVEFWSLDTCLIRGDQSAIQINPRNTHGKWTGTLCLDLASSKGEFVVESSDGACSSFAIDELKANFPAKWHSQIYIPITSDSHIILRPSDKYSDLAYKVALIDTM